MFPDVLQELKSYFGRDFLLGVFFPVLIFLGANLALYLEITQGLVSTLAGWEKLPLASQLLLILGGLVVTLVLSYLIFNFQYSITRLFEGYWPSNRFFNVISTCRRDYRKKRREYLETLRKSASTPEEKSSIEMELFNFYPPPLHKNEVMPTRLGSILRNSEFYVADHYGMDPITIWTRLRPLLPSETVLPLAESITARDFMLLMCVFSAAFTLVWCPILAISTNRLDLFLLCSVGWPLAWICYRSAIQSTFTYGEQVKAAFDLHRHDLLTALKRRIPPNIEEERQEWKDLTLFFSQWSVLPPSPPPEADKAQGLDEVVKALAEYLKKANSSSSSQGSGGEQ